MSKTTPPEPRPAPMPAGDIRPPRTVPNRPERTVEYKKPPVSSPVETRLHPEMPKIPGVEPPLAPAISPKTLQVVIVILILILGIAGVTIWEILHPASKATGAALSADTDTPSAPASSQTTAALAPEATGPVEAASVEQISAPWASNKFTFVNPLTHEAVPAMVLHLPGTAASRSSAYWAFSLNAPYSNCELEYITNLGLLASKFGFHAVHPMVVSPCDNTIYDPLAVTSLPSGAWVRGEVVQGAGIRPPMVINVRVQGNSIIADRIE